MTPALCVLSSPGLGAGSRCAVQWGQVGGSGERGEPALSFIPDGAEVNSPLQRTLNCAQDGVNRVHRGKATGNGDLQKWCFNVILIDFLIFESSSI